MSVELVVYGNARPAGALAIGTRGDGSRFLRHRDGSSLAEWKDAIRRAAAVEIRAMGTEAELGPVHVHATLYVARPRGHYGKRGLRPSAPAYPSRRSVGDVDKLARAVLDALTGVCFVDDAQVVDLVVRKRYADNAGGARAELTVKSMDDLDKAYARGPRGLA